MMRTISVDHISSVSIGATAVAAFRSIFHVLVLLGAFSTVLLWSASRSLSAMAADIPGGWILTDKAVDSDSVTIKASVSLDPSEFESPARIWLAGLSTSTGLCYKDWESRPGGELVQTPRARWTARFTPDEPGEWSYRIYLQSPKFGVTRTRIAGGNLHVITPQGRNGETQKAMVMEFYVSPEGNDQWSGKLAAPNSAHTDGPFRTIERARDAVRELKKQGKLLTPVTVYLRGGMYFLSEPLASL